MGGGGGGGGGGSGIHFSLKLLPIIHLFKIFAYSFKSIPLFIKSLIFLSLIIKSLISLIVCSLSLFPVSGH